jgi:hypothetical protein
MRALPFGYLTPELSRREGLHDAAVAVLSIPMAFQFKCKERLAGLELWVEIHERKIDHIEKLAT